MRKKNDIFQDQLFTEYRTSWQSAEDHTLTSISTKEKKKKPNLTFNAYPS